MYEFQSRVRYSELDSSGTLSMPALLDYYQDCSTFHAEELGLGVEYLKEHKMIWALTSWQIVIHRYPLLGERVTIGTAPYDFRGFIGFRNFWMLDEKGRQISSANSVWSLIHMETGKPTKPTEEMYQGYTLSPKLSMNYADRKVRFAGEGKEQDPVLILPHHLDTNHHVNNGQFVRIAMDYLPEDYKIGQLRAEYKKQAPLNTKLYPFIYQEGEMIGVSLQDKTGGIYCNVEFK